MEKLNYFQSANEKKYNTNKIKKRKQRLYIQLSSGQSFKCLNNIYKKSICKII